MEIEGRIALVTGAARGLGRAFVTGLLERGVARVYAGIRKDTDRARLPADDRVTPVLLDVTSDAEVAAASATAKDVEIVVNNAGAQTLSGIIAAASLEAARQEMEVNYFGLLRVTRAFAPILGARGGGAIINILSLSALFPVPFMGSYGAAKAAADLASKCARAELAGQGTLVMGVYPGLMDTDMAAFYAGDKFPPSVIVASVCEALERGVEEVFPDPMALAHQERLKSDPAGLVREYAAMLPQLFAGA
jgi:NAD(P)-dependent dehydrogenase (short-subunit alcohol dehydrogenase family)